MKIARPIPAAVAAEWHPTRNGTLTPAKVSDGSNRKVWWRCPAGHNWQARVDTRCRPNNRTGRPAGCPECAKPHPAKAGSLQAERPDLASEWDTARNGRTASQVRVCYNRAAHWICPAGHSYQAWVRSRIDRQSGCPYCAGRDVLPGFNDLATTHPATAALWHSELNADLTPQQVSHGSTRIVWWRCSEGHQWQRPIGEQTQRAHPCMSCASSRVRFAKPATIDRRKAPRLTDDRPDLAAEWHPSRNGDLAAADVTRAARLRVWWLCSTCNHEWQAYVQNRVYRNSGCPECAAKITRNAYLAALARSPRHTPSTPTVTQARPDLAALWHPSLNGDLTPSRITTGSTTRKVWLVLPCGCPAQRHIGAVVKQRKLQCAEHGRLEIPPAPAAAQQAAGCPLVA